MESVDNVYKMWTAILFATTCVGKHHNQRDAVQNAVEIYVNPTAEKNPHAHAQKNVYKHVDYVDNLKKF